MTMPIARPANLYPQAQQMIQKLMAFDGNGNGELSRNELAKAALNSSDTALVQLAVTLAAGGKDYLGVFDTRQSGVDARELLNIAMVDGQDNFTKEDFKLAYGSRYVEGGTQIGQAALEDLADDPPQLYDLGNRPPRWGRPPMMWGGYPMAPVAWQQPVRSAFQQLLSLQNQFHPASPQYQALQARLHMLYQMNMMGGNTQGYI